MIETLLELCRLKAVDRAGWKRVGLTDVESVAAHSWGVAWLVLSLCPDDLDRGRCLAYAVLHDAPEVRVGDLTPHDGVPKARKQALELEALQALTSPLGSGARLRSLFNDYERQVDAEARFVKQLDKLDMALQAVVYAEQSGVDTREFLESADRGIEHAALRPLIDALKARLP